MAVFSAWLAVAPLVTVGAMVSTTMALLSAMLFPVGNAVVLMVLPAKSVTVPVV